MPQEKKSIFARLDHFFDRFEDHSRAFLSRHVIIYSLVGGVAIVLFWRGVWMLADEVGLSSISSIIISVVILLATGLFVSFFVGDRIVLSGLRREKKVIDKTEEELKAESVTLVEVKDELKKIEKEIEHLDGNHHESHHSST
ncbi:MAG: hypothetical protein A3C06_03070 [Candidatus Taylorbacteria bacterium RIFCSPHIGHO2_02_FULL_46_13]|uniref:Uncharacterized protein n=1 Tax=Candidatus Taylorbacteria bacterium RIFCSPHIGHO2_02_FULL_46_13 TaxID=1802312 RepID=A0A1G2MRP5_9BACT|nr:MAG: hypothetical protein A3C06_03070 [Candidatus Taylorbacteria bacterium RIFCSPHIGHO2_02_FULL_46_13]